ncbi:prepilin peptidase [Flagellatimonas centrodinii]|uniref:prepilin peptidase n=1 Tax=Flagellatimonas centrodinii TaxID=2806210 RepID=UPI0023BAB57E|nr:A24 family peptidase [Flagellatimonas centrodinii]
MSPLVELLAGNLGLLITLTLVLGLLVGSFLNVVALRLPAMMERDWRIEARQILELPAEAEPPLSLTQPPSTCPQCRQRIRPWHNIPVIGWLWLRGRCADCAAPISPQYPLVELACGLLSAACAWRFGWGPELAAALVLTWSLLVLAVIDARTTLLPDSITLPLLWAGLLLALVPLQASLSSAVIGAAAGYLSLWSVYWAFKLLTGKEGMGYGDFKLFAALGAWLGWQQLLLIILLSSVVGAVVGIGLILARNRGRDLQIPFGPYLAAAGWIALVAGDTITAAYLRSAGL